MSLTPEKLDAYHERIGIKARRHPFTPSGGRDGKPTSGCILCPFSQGHVTHSGAEIVSLAQFRKTRER